MGSRKVIKCIMLGTRFFRNKVFGEAKMKSGMLPAAVAACSLLLAIPASAQVVKIGILNDQSGVYADYGGKYSVEAAKMAVEDFGEPPLLGQKTATLPPPQTTNR